MLYFFHLTISHSWLCSNSSARKFQYRFYWCSFECIVQCNCFYEYGTGAMTRVYPLVITSVHRASLVGPLLSLHWRVIYCDLLNLCWMGWWNNRCYTRYEFKGIDFYDRMYFKFSTQEIFMRLFFGTKRLPYKINFCFERVFLKLINKENIFFSSTDSSLHVHSSETKRFPIFTNLMLFLRREKEFQCRL